MTHQSEPVAWTVIPQDHRRRLITRLSQMAYRQLKAAALVEGTFHDSYDIGLCSGKQEDPGPSSRPTGGGVCPAVDDATDYAAPGIDPPAVWAGGAGAEVGLVAVPGLSD
jgi:hypothetical protein